MKDFHPQIEVNYVDCACSHISHVLRFTYIPADKDGWDEPYLEVSTMLDRHLPWYRRVAVAFRYLLGLDCRCPYTESMLSEGSVNKIRKVFDKAYPVKD